MLVGGEEGEEWEELGLPHKALDYHSSWFVSQSVGITQGVWCVRS